MWNDIHWIESFLARGPNQKVQQRGELIHCGSAGRVENGTGKSRPDRLRLPFKPTINCFCEKMGKWENKRGKRAGTGTGTVGVFSRPFSRFPFSAEKIPAGIPVFVVVVVVGCVTCVGKVNCCLHVLQRELWIRDSLYLCFLVIRVLFPCYLCIVVIILLS